MWRSVATRRSRERTKAERRVKRPAFQSLSGIEADDGGGAEAEGEGSHEAHGGEDAEGGKKKMAGVEEVGVHASFELWVMSFVAKSGLAAKARKPTHWAVRRSAGEPVLRRRDPAVVL